MNQHTNSDPKGPKEMVCNTMKFQASTHIGNQLQQSSKGKQPSWTGECK